MSQSTGTIKIFFINSAGEGFSNYLEVRDGTTVGDLFRQKMAGKNAPDFRIRVNKEPVAEGYMLRNEDKVSFTPRNIKGA